MNLITSLARVSLLGLLLACAPVWAQNCRMSDGYAPLVNLANLNGSITVGPDVPVGTEIFRATYYAGPTNQITCTAGRIDRIHQYTSLPHRASSYVHPSYGTVYETNVPGVGVAVWYNGSGFPRLTEGETNVQPPTVFLLWPVQSYDVSLIKIGPISAGTVTGASLPQFEYRMTGANRNVLIWSGRVQGSLNIVSRTCSTNDVPADLGTHQMSEIPAVGSATGWVNVPVVLRNCPAFFGRYRGHLTTGTVQSANGRVDNRIRYRVDPVTAVADRTRSVMALQDDGVNMTATGIGIQIGTQTQDSVGFNAMRDSGLTLTETNNAQYTIMLRARYYRLAATASSGQANGAATITLEYN
ncbi:fimbrial protein [Stenotrophomonas sp. C1657]|uniref:fimbrial protein n=1 Tax=Stenotrophomonas sp. C1657 TaxID=3077844 RepID=UPI00293D06D4|nr:fimbrial protein [Stenotrophomonas sp. C1657]MDV3514084.1 fimbrial protein [Stenotrophomonas sp. C1657]